MAVKVRERKGAWWVFVDHKGRRKAKRVGVGKGGKRAAESAAEKIQARLALGDTSPLEDNTSAPPVTFEQYALLARDSRGASLQVQHRKNLRNEPPATYLPDPW